MRAPYRQAEENDSAIAGYFAACVLICGVAVFGFYKLMQPTQYANPGLAAYKTPRGIVYPLEARSYEQPVVSVATEPLMPSIADETTGRAVQTVKSPPAVAPSPTRQVAVAPSPTPQVTVAPSPSKEVGVAPTPPTEVAVAPISSEVIVTPSPQIQIKKESRARAVAARSDDTKTRQALSPPTVILRALLVALTQDMPGSIEGVRKPKYFS